MVRRHATFVLSNPIVESMILFTMIIRYCKICFWFYMPSVPSTTRTGLIQFCLCSCINNSCMEVQSVGVTYNKLVVSKAGDFTVHMSHIMYFFLKRMTIVCTSSENDPLLDILSLVGHNPNPLSMIFISNIRHSHVSYIYIYNQLYHALYNLVLVSSNIALSATICFQTFEWGRCAWIAKHLRDMLHLSWLINAQSWWNLQIKTYNGRYDQDR